jgi:hypothetical protein
VRSSPRMDACVVATSPKELLNGFTPIDLDWPDDLVFCCFFRSREERTDFLKRLRSYATIPCPTEPDAEAQISQLLSRYEKLRKDDESIEAFFTAAEWWVGTMRRGYHSYSLRVGVGPYRTSCVISFRELTADQIRGNLSLAVHSIEVEKDRVMNALGIGGLYHS